VATLTSGGPRPCIAYATRVPSADAQNRIWVVDNADPRMRRIRRRPGSRERKL
jgi:hypothetical protein